MPNSNRYIPFLPLPEELLLHIFKLATENPLRYMDHYVDMPPFESIESRGREDVFDVALKIKRSIALTCSAFRRLSAEILYEDIRVGHGASALADSLERSEADTPGAGVGRLVKRAVLVPVASESSGSQSTERMGRNTRRILVCCPNIRAILRGKNSIPSEDGVVEEAEAGNTPKGALLLRSLERIDWLSCPADDPPIIAEMPHSVWSSESLKTLSVGVKEWARFTGMRETEIVNLFSTIRTLRVRSVDAFGLPGQRLFSLELPSFRRLILDQPDSMYALFGVVQFADQIETLEFGLHSGFLEHDYIMVLLVYCPTTTELYFPVFTTFATRTSTRGAAFTYNIRHVILHAAMEDESEVDETWKWAQLTSHFLSLCGEGTRFDKLERITLYGTEWRGLVGDPRFQPSLHLIDSRISLVCEDEEAGVLLEQNRAAMPKS